MKKKIKSININNLFINVKNLVYTKRDQLFKGSNDKVSFDTFEYFWLRNTFNKI